MYGPSLVPRFVLLVCLLSASLGTAADSPAAAPNADPIYQQLRNLALGSEAVSVSNFTFHRDAATFHLHSGTVCFAAPVNGKITGAFFMGDGNFILEPPIAIERSTLHLLTKENEFSENFARMVLRFTDQTAVELKKAGSPASVGCPSNSLRDSQNAMRHDRVLKYNLEARILQDVLSTEPGGLFVAFVHGKRYSDKEIFAVDPHGAPPLVLPVAPEEVELVTYDENKLGVWAAFHFSEEYKNGTASGAQDNSVMQISHQQLDTTIEKNANLIAESATTFVAKAPGLRVIPLNLYRTLRVQSVKSADGQPLSFIQEDKNDDADFSVILPRPLSAGESCTLKVNYAGKDAVSNEGGGNYFPIARENWYPNNPNFSLGSYATYDMTFRIPKGMQVAATGDLVNEHQEGNQNVSVWKSAGAITVAGFNFGKFKREETRIPKLDFTVSAYANEDQPDWIRSLQRAADPDLPSQGDQNALRNRPEVVLGNMSTVVLNKKALAEGELSMQIYSDYFGPLREKTLSISQQTAGNFGQSWPSLVWLPLTYFLDTTVRHQLRMDDPHAYFKVVAPHEVAHQWWGHAVGFNSYRDQWMSEGFADASASIYLQLVYAKEPHRFISFWDDERQLLTERNKEGFRAIDAGPVTLGYRLSNSRSGYDITRRLIYPKGAYILHMIRMMMWDRRTGDQNFKLMMQDFVKTYMGRSATTEDFKQMVEKHMTPEMDLSGNHSMNWFFDEYVYGTELPAYKLDASFDKAPNGDVVVSFKVNQTNVSDSFRMLVPIYLELADGRNLFLGRVRLAGSTSFEQKVPLNGLKEVPRRAVVNYNDDVLASN
jgi:hypothetical protein